ncbi:hypothetical protein ACJD0Z_12510 [Flavobacteriaceae bacterium M23B6Z8]
MGNLKNHPLVIKWSSWEYWPMYVLYIPVCFQHLWLSLRAWNPFFFLTANPAINEGFILSDSKYNTLKLVPEAYRPRTLFVKDSGVFEAVMAEIKQMQIDFPLILKPDRGYRGLHVHRVSDQEELRSLISNIKVPHIIQEYISHNFEIGIFYYRFPGSKTGHIPSITIKEFLSVTGDGIHTLQELVNQNQRAILQKEKLRTKFAAEWEAILEKDQVLVLEFIGNHNRGTKFVNGQQLYDEQLLTVFDELNHQMKGFYYGRFDIRTASIESLKHERSFKILEVNGVGAEPTHIYDPSYKITKAWSELLFLWRVVFKIAAMRKKAGNKYVSFKEGTRRFTSYLKYTKAFK